MAPDSTRRLASRKLASKRRMKPICSFTPLARHAAIISSHSSTVMAMGFSQKMCLPALAQSTTMSRCRSVGATTMTALMALSPRIWR
jgi:hypothetical protein